MVTQPDNVTEPEVAGAPGASTEAGVAGALATPTEPGVVTVRYFAAIAEAAGLESEQFSVGTLGELIEAMLAAHPQPEFAQTLAACTFLLGGRFVEEPSTPVPAGFTLDLLPPFAGG